MPKTSQYDYGNSYDYQSSYNADPYAGIPKDPNQRGHAYAGSIIGGSPYVYGTYSPTTTNTANQAGAVMSLLNNGGGGYGDYYANLANWFGSLNADSEAMYNEDVNFYKNLYNDALKQIKLDNERAQRQNYLNNRVNMRDFQQINAAQGLSGGASETALANQLNKYASNRNATDMNTENNIASILRTLDENLYKARQAHNERLMANKQKYINAML